MLRIGHRGAMGYEPENTLKSFDKALELDVDMIELDVHICKSGELVIIHDDRVDRTTNGQGYIVDKTFEELRLLDAGKGEKIPTLEEVLDLVDKKVQVNIELKAEKTAQPVANVIDKYINKGWANNHFLVSSFNHYELKKFNKLKSDIRIGALIGGIPIGYSNFAKELNAYSLHPTLEFINRELVDNAHNNGLKVLVYTVNNKDDINKMREWGVDGLFSNYPDRI